MTTNADAIAALEKSKAALEAQTDAASGDTLDQLTDSIHKISQEVGALETSALNDATYVPATDAFKNVTDDAKAFVTTLNGLKNTFAGIETVASALDSVISLITKLGL